MLKVRLMGTKNDIVWFQKILQRHPKVEVLEISELYSNKGTNKYYRAYAEVQKSNIKSYSNRKSERWSWKDHHNKQFRNRTDKTWKESFTDRCRCTGQSYGKSWHSGAGQTGNYTCNHYGSHYQ